MSIFSGILNGLKKVPIIGPGIGVIELAVGESTVQEQIYAKIERAISYGSTAVGVVSGILMGPAGGVVGGAIANFLTQAALDDGSLKAEINKLDTGDATKIYAALNVHPVIASL